MQDQQKTCPQGVQVGSSRDERHSEQGGAVSAPVVSGRVCVVIISIFGAAFALISRRVLRPKFAFAK